ncbi:MAG TPA: DnaA/Hda family protein [SAR86 cluster bacterium]|jgi:DnaA family protein|nr:DnaA/Hda family protein [SAR86 cluster bacterium]HJM15739.1 DnaA/Hda family protein [SAR86 cluster bacterium]|tara:strand:+ start:3082 stop:3792 length:711 start_codon:yes stop_codon:yes gene_type:complete
MNKLPEQLHLNVQLDDSINLDNFISCDSTKDFLNIISNTTEDNSISNFYLIWGNEGRGKSYVMRALHRKYLEDGKQSFHFSFKDKKVTSPEILTDLDSLEAVFIEDLHSMEISRDWEKAMFNLINECYLSGTKVYLSSNIVPKDLKISLKDLSSRLSSFTAIEVPEITEEEKIQALLQSSERKGFLLDDKTINYIISYTSRSLSDLLRLLNELDSFSLQKKKKISPSLVREMVSSK